MKKRIILASDIHDCHIDFYEYGTENRLNLFVDALIEENESDPIDAIILLGDYSLDHWAYNIKGCYITEGKSYTNDFVTKYLSRIKSCIPNAKYAVTAGNHEQYGNELWKKITGHERNDIIVLDDYVFIILDTFAGDLDPTEHSDGTYTGASIETIKSAMKKYPDSKIILASHYFDPEKESEEFSELCKNDRIICLFCGHNHKWDHTNPENFAGKNTIYTGNFSYNGIKVDRPMWGYRELIIDKDKLTSRYIIREVTLNEKGDEKHYPHEIHDEIIIDI